ncbi:MAG: malate dehydrogenase [Candidatus Nomurabacteria bacterium]|nr:malate dehydrogenase [Candidatus Nomurabacteria bacterium]
MKKDYSKSAIELHKKYKGKLSTVSLAKLQNKDDLSVLYTPGVAAVSLAIAKDKKLARVLTMKGRTIAVVTDGSAVLGLGNIGPEAALPVMEGKSVLFKEFGGLDSVPIVLGTQNVEEIISIVKAISPGFAGINLEDISAPRCFEIESRLIEELDIPVMHDDQHGTAIVVLAALINSLKITKKKAEDVKVVISGAGAASTATLKLLLKAGVKPKNVLILDSKGIIHIKREDLNNEKINLCKLSNGKHEGGDLEKALIGADVFIGMSMGNILKKEWVETMNDNPIIFALANPVSEISYEDALKTKAKVIGTGRSDHPNQINNVLAFPGVFRGAIDSGAKRITDKMKIAAAHAIASLVSKVELSKGIIIPDPFNKKVAKSVAAAVAKAK